MKKKLSLIVPIYQCGDRALEDFELKYSTLESFLSKEEFELIYVFDGKDGKSIKILKNHIKQNSILNVKLIHRKDNKGKGFSVIEGFTHATGKFVGYNDFGKDAPVKYIKKMYEIISQEPEIDAVLPNKFHPESDMAISLKRKIYSYGYRYLVRIILGKNMPDPQTGIKLFRGASLRQVLPHLLVKRFVFEVELLTALAENGLDNWKYVPIKIELEKDSTIKFWDKFKNDVPRFLLDTFQVAYRKIIRKWYKNGLKSKKNPIVEKYYHQIEKEKKILIFNWKCIYNSKSGGAETLLWELARRLVGKGYYIHWVTSKQKDLPKWEFENGIEVSRIVGNRYLHIFVTILNYLLFQRNKYDIIIEAANTAPYFMSLLKGKEKVHILYHQLARKTWFWEAPFPINILGYFILEPASLILQAIFGKSFITVSDSTKSDLTSWGIEEEKINIISEGIKIKPLKRLSDSLPKEDLFTVMYLGSLRKMKRPEEVIKAFGVFNNKFEKSKLWIVGGGSNKRENYLKKIVKNRNLKKKVKFWGKVSNRKKRELLQRAHVLGVTSVKEGWGLVVTEANVVGTPAVVYNVDGLINSVKDGETGLVCTENTPKSFARNLKLLYLNRSFYKSLRKEAFKWGKEVNFNKSLRQLHEIID